MSYDTSLTKFVPPHKIENGYMTSWLKLGECLDRALMQKIQAERNNGQAMSAHKYQV